jgi:arginine deiminase
MPNFINVHSEIGVLKKVLLYRPSLELKRLMPDFLERMLFDDIPFLDKAQEEHDQFAAILKKEGAQVLYLTDLLKETIQDKSVKDALIQEFCETNLPILGRKRVQVIIEFFKTLSIDSLIDHFCGGVLKSELPDISKGLYEANNSEDDPFLVDPLPNLYFTRDPAASIGNGISISHMRWDARKKETLFLTYILKHHPEIKKENIPLWHERTGETNIEGGDELVLTQDTMAIGISQRTNANSVEKLALKLFNSDSGYKKIYGVVLPESHAFMHLDTVFTMVDYDKFVMHPAVMVGQSMRIFCLEPGTKDSVKVTEEKDLKAMLSKIIGKTPTLIPCGGGDIIDAAREQWNDGSNTLAIKPGVVVTYSSNVLSNRSMEEHGIKVHSFYGPEIGKGRGGPRCMSMPLYRESI